MKFTTFRRYIFFLVAFVVFFALFELLVDYFDPSLLKINTRKSLQGKPYGSYPVRKSSVTLTDTQKTLVAGARSRLGDRYDARYFSQGFPPEGRSACVDVVYFAYKNASVDLQAEVDKDIRTAPEAYPDKADPAIVHRRCPNLIVWFQRHEQNLPTGTRKQDLINYQPGDVIFWSMAADGVADHAGVVSDEATEDGWPLIIHQLPPKCRMEDTLDQWKVVGHFRKDD